MDNKLKIMTPSTTAYQKRNLENIVITELAYLRESEDRLQRLYTRLGKKPHLRDEFMSELAELQMRADRVDALIDPMPFRNSTAAYNGQGGLIA
jgi:hypothetical protein